MNSYNTIIIGSGISGIFTLKHLIEEGNKNVLVLDKNPEPFGVWNINNKHSVFENTYAVSSKLYMTISDFPLPEKTPEFPHHSIILNYYKAYANHFNLYEYIKQNVTVYSVKKNNNTLIKIFKLMYDTMDDNKAKTFLKKWFDSNKIDDFNLNISKDFKNFLSK